jgi:hypothetical protein
MSSFLIAAVLSAAAGPPADTPASRPDDVKLIAAWLLGKDDQGAFARDFGDSKLLTSATDLVTYSDVAQVEWPQGAKAVPYDFIKARMQRIRSGRNASPAILITGSIRDDPAEEGDVLKAKRVKKEMKGERYYYVEVAIGNLAWHWMKIAVGDDDGKAKAVVLWRKES